MRLLLENAKSISGPPTGHPVCALQSLKDPVVEGPLSGKFSGESLQMTLAKLSCVGELSWRAG